MSLEAARLVIGPAPQLAHLEPGPIRAAEHRDAEADRHPDAPGVLLRRGGAGEVGAEADTHGIERQMEPGGSVLLAEQPARQFFLPQLRAHREAAQLSRIRVQALAI